MRSYFKTVKLLLSADKQLLAKCFLIIILFLGLESSIPLYMRWMINKAQGGESIKNIIIYIVGFVFAYLLLCIVDGKRAESYEYLGKHVIWKVREKIYNVLWHSDYATYIREYKEKFKFIITTETYLMFAITTIYSLNLIINLMTIVALVLIAAYINNFIAYILIASFVLTFILSFYTGKKILTNYQLTDDTREQDTIANNENVDMVEEIRTNGFMDYYYEKNKKALDNFINKAAVSDRTEAFWMSVERAIHAIIYLLIAYVVTLSGNDNGGQMVAALFIANYVLQTSQQFQQQLQVVLKNIPVFDKVMDVADIPLENGKDVDPIEVIKFDNVGLSYGENRTVFENISFEIRRGDNVLVEGVNGSGKSSLLKMIVGLLTPSHGEITINGENINKFNKQNLYKEICYISQDEMLLNESIENYIKIASHKNISNASIKKVRDYCKLNQEVNFINANGANLSGGEKKKVLMMKSLLRTDISVLILDEIDAGLDAETKEIMKKIENEFTKNKDIIVIKISHIDTDKNNYNKHIKL